MTGRASSAAGALLLTLACGCAQAPLQPAPLPAVRIDPAALLGHIRTLASDAFEGRQPGTRGAELTVDYLVDAFKRAGLAPGNPDGRYVQDVPLVGITSSSMAVSVAVKGERLAWEAKRDYTGGNYQARAQAQVLRSRLVFVGYGVVAPEHGWDDYKDVDVRGKTIVVLMDDPQIPDAADPRRLDPSMFKGSGKTYYATNQHKRETAVARGAAARIGVHETERAGGASFEVFANGHGRESFVLRDAAEPEFDVDLFISTEAARELLRRAGHDLEELRSRAKRRDFRPIEIDATLDADVRNTVRDVPSHNVVAKAQGRDPTGRDEAVVYTAHWDHLGRDPTLPGDPVFHGALDNASGVAALLEVAGAYARLPEAPARTVLFIATTAEEDGLLGARHYVSHPIVPLAKTLADLNLDLVNAWGRTRDFSITGSEDADIDAVLAEVAAAHGKRHAPDQSPELGVAYRQDAFEFARAGVPAFYVRMGVDFIDKPADHRERTLGAYLARDYHHVTDTVRDDWDLAGGAEQAELAFAIGWRLADGAPFPQWRAGAEFKAKREAMLRDATAALPR